MYIVQCIAVHLSGHGLLYFAYSLVTCMQSQQVSNDWLCPGIHTQHMLIRVSFPEVLLILALQCHVRQGCHSLLHCGWAVGKHATCLGAPARETPLRTLHCSGTPQATRASGSVSCWALLYDMGWPLRAMGAIQMRTVLSSEADASMRGLVGFQLTLFTVPEWPSSCASRSPLSLCQMCTRQSCNKARA